MDASKVNPELVIKRPFWGLGRFAPFQVELGVMGDKTYRVFWTRCVVWGLGFLMAGWWGASGAAYFFVKHRRGFTDAEFTHFLFLPWKMEDYRRSRGLFLLEQGKEDLEARDYRAAFIKMRVGLGQMPYDVEARKFVAGVYLQLNRADLAREVIFDRIERTSQDLDFLQWCISALFSRQLDDTVLELAERLLAAGEVSDEGRYVLQFARASAYFLRGRFAEAEAAMEQEGLLRSRSGRLLQARVFWESGRQARAMQVFEAVAQLVPEDQEAYQELLKATRQLGRWDEARRLTLARRLRLPDQPLAYVDHVAVLHAEGATARRDEAIEEVLEKFAANREALQRLAGFAAETGEVGLARRLQARAREAGLSAHTFRLAVTEASLSQRDFDGAMREVMAGLREESRLSREEVEDLRALRALALYGMGDDLDADNLIDAYLFQPYSRADKLNALGKRLLALGVRGQAYRVFQRAVEVDPLNAAALQNLMELSLATGRIEDLMKQVEQRLALRRPPEDFLGQVKTMLRGDAYLFVPGREAFLERLP